MTRRPVLIDNRRVADLVAKGWTVVRDARFDGDREYGTPMLPPAVEARADAA